MQQYKIKQHQRTKEIVSLLGQESKVMGADGLYLMQR
jgi:hypothetical protein